MAIITVSLPIQLNTPRQGGRSGIKQNEHYYMLFNEGATDVTTKITIPVSGETEWLDPWTAKSSVAILEEEIHFNHHEFELLKVNEY